jgi:[3-methyl-2-oxobutanoate dehydrogenase (acetyl-transferring)] kinase
LKLPHVVVSNPKINEVLSTYVETFEVLHRFPKIENAQDENLFFEVMKHQLYAHSPGTRLVAEGYKEVRRLYPDLRLDEFLHDHFTTRIATRILMENYVEMRNPRENFVGVVRQGMRPVGIVQDIASEIISLTRSLYGTAPALEYRGNLDCVLDYIPRHVEYMVREIIKNAFRSTVERHRHRDNIPPVVVELQQGEIHVIIKISDQGGGMSKKFQQEAWQYGWTTVASNGGLDEETGTWKSPSAQQKQSELAGYGFGLPLTRLHAQYFGGDVFLQALPGHGIDMYLILTHLKEGTESTEIDDLSTILYQKENQTTDSTALP